MEYVTKLMVVSDKGLLVADESFGTIGKKLIRESEKPKEYIPIWA